MRAQDCKPFYFSLTLNFFCDFVIITVVTHTFIYGCVDLIL